MEVPASTPRRRQESLFRTDTTEVQTFTDLQMGHSRMMAYPQAVSLLGGIGDHLEAISILLGGAASKNTH